jgi:hypothetical protein
MPVFSEPFNVETYPIRGHRGRHSDVVETRTRTSRISGRSYDFTRTTYADGQIIIIVFVSDKTTILHCWESGS